MKAILDEALKLHRTERRGFVAEACADDEAVRQEVESLLVYDGVTAPFLEQPIFFTLDPDVLKDTDSGQPEELVPGQRIGPYQIVRVLGEGGMGTVALAVRENDFEKEVALKIIRRGVASSEAVRRFHAERQIVARLEHPSITRILDGGTTDDGRPYFVMEYVEGRSIDRYCSEEKLPLHRRLELFRQVCAAVQFAHQHLIVHRDLKPGNILVTADGTPKLLDFGIAKKQAPKPGVPLTASDNQPMTLHFASPEQVEGQPTTTASDIYSLGVLLYQLLTGHRPYAGDPSSFRTLKQAIRQEKPRKPSTVVPRGGGINPWASRRFADDLDCIVLKTLEKDPKRRYSSVEHLSEDIHRHLEGLPVQAHQAAFRYLAVKFICRHKLPLAMVVTVLLLALAFAVTTTVLWRKAIDERERREVVVKVMSELFWVPVMKEAPGQEPRVRHILENSLEKVDLLAAEPPLQAEILQAAAATYVELGNDEEALDLRHRSVRILRSHYRGQEHPDLARAINNLATSHYQLQHTADAERLYREALAMKRALALDDIDRAKSMSNLATILTNRGALAEAEPLYRQALAIREEAYGPDDVDVATSLRSLGNLLYLKSEAAQAEPLLHRALEIRHQIYGVDSREVAAVLSTLARVFQAQGRAAQAEELFLQALEIRRQRFGKEGFAVAITKTDLAALHLDRGEFDRAEALLTEALKVLRAREPEPWQLAQAKSLLGALRTAQGRYDEAEPHLLKSAQKLAELRGEVIYTHEVRRRLRELYLAWGKSPSAIPNIP